MKTLLDIISEEDGRTSSARVAALAIVVVVMGMAVYCTVTGKPMAIMPTEYVGLVMVGLGAKVWQKKYENEKPAAGG